MLFQHAITTDRISTKIKYKMKRILIALDYAPAAQTVAETGFAVFENQHTEFTLLHVITDPTYYGSTVYDPIMGFGGYTNLNLMEPDVLETLKKTSYDFLEKSKNHLGGNNINIMVREGDASTAIIEVAKEIKADVIVMGSHSRNWLEHILLGATAESVLHHAGIPMFIIPVKK
jgi:nucleotide-binding universal stress UspA family protein